MDEKHPTRFKPGQSGNPAGRPAGSKNKATLMLEGMIEGRLAEVVEATVDSAVKGRQGSQKIIFDQYKAVTREKTVTIDLPEMETPQDLVVGHARIVAAIGRGEITPDQAVKIAQVLDSQRRAFDSAEVERRLAELEEAVGLGPA